MSKQHRLWTKEEIEFLKQNINKLSYSQLAEKLNRSWSSIRNKTYELGLIKEPKTMPNIWDDSKIEFLKKNYLSMTYEELSKHLGICVKAIRRKLSKLGLKKVYIRQSFEPKEETKKILTCNDICKRRKPAGIGLSGNEIYYCPVFHITMGKYARPSEKCSEVKENENKM
jgi:hypothetical protein